MLTTSRYSKRISAPVEDSVWLVHLPPRQMQCYLVLKEGSYTLAGLSSKMGVSPQSAGNALRELGYKMAVSVVHHKRGVKWYSADTTVTVRAAD
jgi:hypothetical protein